MRTFTSLIQQELALIMLRGNVAHQRGMELQQGLHVLLARPSGCTQLETRH